MINNLKSIMSTQMTSLNNLIINKTSATSFCKDFFLKFLTKRPSKCIQNKIKEQKLNSKFSISPLIKNSLKTIKTIINNPQSCLLSIFLPNKKKISFAMKGIRLIKWSFMILIDFIIFRITIKPVKCT